MYSFTLTQHTHLYISLTLLNEYGKYGKNMENLNVVLLTVFCVKHAARCKLELIITSDICVITLTATKVFHKISIKLSIKMVPCIA